MDKKKKVIVMFVFFSIINLGIPCLGDIKQSYIVIPGGCGSTHCIGEYLTVELHIMWDGYYSLSSTTLFGEHYIFVNSYLSVGTHPISSTVGEPEGEHVLKLYHTYDSEPENYLNLQSSEEINSKLRGSHNKSEHFYVGNTVLADSCNFFALTCRHDENCTNGIDDDRDGLVDCDDPDCANHSQCDPCKNKICENECSGCDYWKMKCVGGKCVKDYIIEENSSRCGSQCGKKCDPGWDCIDSNSKAYRTSNCEWDSESIVFCEYGCENGECKSPDLTYSLKNRYEGAKSIGELIKLLLRPLNPSPADVIFIPPEIDVDINVFLSDYEDVLKVLATCSEPMGQRCTVEEIAKSDVQGYVLSHEGDGHYKNTEPIRHCSQPLVDLIFWAIDKGCGGCLNAKNPIEPPFITSEILVIYKNGSILTETLGRLPTWYDAVWEVIDNIKGSEDLQIFIGSSPINLTVIDEHGKRVGALYSENNIYTGEVNEIPGAIYSGSEITPEFIIVPYSTRYTLYIRGSGKGKYSIETIAIKNNESESNKIFREIDTGDIHKYDVSMTDEGEIKINTFKKRYWLITIFIFIVIFSIISYYFVKNKRLFTDSSKPQLIKRTSKNENKKIKKEKLNIDGPHLIKKEKLKRDEPKLKK